MGRTARVIVGSFVATGALIAAACGSFSENATPAPTSDASDGPAADDGSSGGPVDANVSDASVADVTDASWSLLFKDDFEAGLVPWNEEVEGSADLFITAEGALRVRTANDVSGFGYAWWQPPSTLDHQELRIDLQVYPVKIGQPFPCVVTVQPGPAQRPNIRLQPLVGGTPTLHHEHVEAGVADDHPFVGQLASGKWNDVSMELRFGNAPRGKVVYNGNVVLDVALAEPFAIARPQIGVGLTCSETNADFVFENVFVYGR